MGKILSICSDDDNYVVNAASLRYREKVKNLNLVAKSSIRV